MTSLARVRSVPAPRARSTASGSPRSSRAASRTRTARRPRRHSAAGVAAGGSAAGASSSASGRPLLDSKFDGRYDDLPATYIWARSRRMSTTRDSHGQRGDGLARRRLPDADRRARARDPRLGGEIHAGTPVRAIVGDDAVTGSSCRSGFRPVRPRPLHARACRRRAALLLASGWCSSAAADHCRYLGVICLVLRTRRQRQPVLHPEHHRPPRPAHDDRRDDARGRPGRGRRHAPLRLQVRRPGTSRPRAAGRRRRRGVPRARASRSSRTSGTRTSSTRACSARE